jgi:uncharacterized membrane protein
VISLLDLVTIFFAGQMVGNEFAIAAFVHPAISRLEAYPHLAAAKPIAAVLGRVMPFWYGLCLVALLIELWAKRTQPHQFELVAVATVLWVAMIAYTVSVLVPINNRIAAANPNQPYSGWEKDRARWDAHHRIRVAVLALAFAFLLGGVLRVPMIVAE